MNRSFPVISSLMIYHGVCNKSSMTGVTCGTETAYHSGAPEFTPWGSCYSVFSFLCSVLKIIVWIFFVFGLSSFDFFSDYLFGMIKLFL